MITNTFRSPIKSTYLWLPLGALCSIVLLIIYLKVQDTKAQHEARQVANLAMKEKLESELGNKTLTEIKELLNEEIESLDDRSNRTHLRTSAATSDDSDPEEFEFEPFSPTSAADMQAKFDLYLNSLMFGQKIVGGSSYVQTGFRETHLNALVPDYVKYQYPPVQIKTTLVHFKDGTSLSPTTNNSDDVTFVKDNKRIVAVDVSATYTLPGSVKQLTFEVRSNARKEGISLQAVTDGEVSLTMPLNEYDKILNVQAFNAQGKSLMLKDHSSYTSNEYYIEKYHAFLLTAVKHIDSGNFNNVKQLLSYLVDHRPSKEDIAKEHPPETLAMWQFSGTPTSVVVFLKPTSYQRTYSFTVTEAEKKYYNGLTTAADDHGVYGLIDEQGNWLIKPTYHRLAHKVDDYYGLTNAKGDDQIFLLDRVAKTMTPQPFYIMDSTLYQNRYVVINKESANNNVQGLVDTTTHKVILPLKYDSIDIESPFITTSQHRGQNGRNARQREVYLQSNGEMIIGGEFDELAINNSIIITRSEIRTKKQLKVRSVQSKDGGGNYIYNNYDIYNAEGKRLNFEPYSDISDHFGLDDLLLVTDIKNNTFYIDREARKSNIDLTDFQQVKPFSNGFAAVQGNNDKFGYIDTQGKLVIPFLYDKAGFFSGGTALTEEAGIYRLISPNNTSIAILYGDLKISSAGKDGETARYTFMTSDAREVDDVYTVYDQRGGVIPD
ncbi:WG repeat-containing protein [Pseudomonas sp. WS 5412]|uniref:WG repeat-containing protein n=1 Tax=Pseudomonas sp. WS 5412 TaxID=2717487 RepID=UPI001472D10B|nr:WG repeat-containing protein [Pseudomonas sp. WS 5412]NMY30661.1 WG repeat-containing protein [Pseudomonas sp. WS 5412]